jgi:hypothetical protein
MLRVTYESGNGGGKRTAKYAKVAKSNFTWRTWRFNLITRHGWLYILCPRINAAFEVEQ